MSNLPEINGWVLIALGVGLAAGYIFGFIEGKRFQREVADKALDSVLDEDGKGRRT